MTIGTDGSAPGKGREHLPQCIAIAWNCVFFLEKALDRVPLTMMSEVGLALHDPVDLGRNDGRYISLLERVGQGVRAVPLPLRQILPGNAGAVAVKSAAQTITSPHHRPAVSVYLAGRSAARAMATEPTTPRVGSVTTAKLMET